MMALFWDLGRLLWLTSLLAAIVWLPAAVAARSVRPSILRMFEQLVTTTVVTVVAVSILSPAHLLNPFTLLVAHAAWPFAQWLTGHRRAIGSDARSLSQDVTLKLARRIETTAHWRQLVLPQFAAATFRAPRGKKTGTTVTPGASLIVLAMVVSLTPVFAVAIANTRFSNAGEYSVLLTAQQLFAGEMGWRLPDVVASITAAISVVSAITPVHVLRFLVPLAGAAALLTFVAVVRLTTRSSGPAVMGTMIAAAMLAGAAQTATAAVGTIFILLSVGLWFAYYSGRSASPWTATAAGILAILVAPTMSSFAPYGWALLTAGLTHVVVRRYRFQRPPVRIAFAAAILALAAAVTVPRTVAAQFVEYDAAARKTLDIATQFPKYKWMIVAPIEQWPLSYGRGWHMNLHEFVDEIGSRINEDAYRLPYRVDDLFVFVETRPFPTFASEPADVPFEILVDPVYRNYRSPAGRSSLQFAAYKLCERLRTQDPNAGLYFDDGRLKIYRFTLR